MKKENSCSTTCDQKTEQYIYRKIAESAEAYREKLEADPSLAHIELTDEMRADMQRRIAAIKAESAVQEGAAVPAEESVALHDAASAENAVKLEDTAASAGDAVALGDDASTGNAAKLEDTAASAAESTSSSAPETGALSEEDRHALEIGRKVLRVKKHGKVLRRLGVAAAVALGVFGISMTSSANRLWLLQLWDQMAGKEKTVYADNWKDIEAYNTDMQRIFSEIQEKSGIHVPYLIYIPKGLKFDNYVIYENLNMAQLFYQYDDTIMTIDMKKELQQTSRGFTFDGDIQETIEVENSSYGTIMVSVVSAPRDETDYVAEFVHDGCQYTIYGVLPREEFLKMIEEIQIF